MNQFHRNYKDSILRVCEKVEALAEIGIQQGISQRSDFFPYLPNFRLEIMNIKTDEGFKSYYGNWGAQELKTLIHQVCGKVCVCACNNGVFPVTVHDCASCPIACYRENYGSDEEDQLMDL